MQRVSLAYCPRLFSLADHVSRPNDLRFERNIQKCTLYLVCHVFLMPIAEIIILIFHSLLVTSHWILLRDSILGSFL